MAVTRRGHPGLASFSVSAPDVSPSSESESDPLRGEVFSNVRRRCFPDRFVPAVGPGVGELGGPTARGALSVASARSLVRDRRVGVFFGFSFCVSGVALELAGLFCRVADLGVALFAGFFFLVEERVALSGDFAGFEF